MKRRLTLEVLETLGRLGSHVGYMRGVRKREGIELFES